jgi:DNA-binding IclR family transcriptional regulator
MKAVAGKYSIQAVSQALVLLEQFQVGNAELGITDLSKRMNLQKNYVFRLIATLEEKKYIKMNSSTGKYRLGIKTMTLGQVAAQIIDFVGYARPFLDELKQQSHETCCFSVVKDGHTCFLDSVESDLTVRVVQQVGTSRPLHCTAAGRAQLAFMEPQKRLDLLSRSEIVGLTTHTIVDANVLQNVLNSVAQQGYAIDNQEYDIGVMEIAAPVFGSHGTVMGALSISGPEVRLSRTRLENELIPLLCRSASRFSNILGFSRQERVFIVTRPIKKPKRMHRSLREHCIHSTSL